MAFFQKKPLVGTSIPLYRIGQQRTLLLVGLGNPGKRYDSTRHNIGFACLDRFQANQDFPAWINKKDLKAELSTLTIGDSRIILAKPTTYMNLSGQAVQAIMHFYKLTPKELLVVHDELDIAFGQIRVRRGGSSAGNNGVASIMQQVGEDFLRVRIGIRNETTEQADSADFVLERFNKDEAKQLPALTREVTVLLTEHVHGQGLDHETRSFIV